MKTQGKRPEKFSVLKSLRKMIFRLSFSKPEDMKTRWGRLICITDLILTRRVEKVIKFIDTAKLFKI